MDKELYVITMVSNPVRYKSRYALYHKFEHEMKLAGVKLLTVEIAFGHRPFEITHSDNPWNLQLRCIDEMWYKENAINIGIQYLSKIAPSWKYVAWVDADIEFVRKDWAMETVQQLQHYQFVQMWQTALDLGPEGETIATHLSFMYQYSKGAPYCYRGPQTNYYEAWHPGYSWAANRDALDAVGQLIDTAILGAGDNHMAHGLIGMLDGTLAPGLHPNYVVKLKEWQGQAERYIRRDVGYVPGTIIHYWHGKKRQRYYHDRWKILVNNQYDPFRDLKKDCQGLYQIVDHGDLRSIKFRDDLRKYFRSRNEDSIDLD